MANSPGDRNVTTAAEVIALIRGLPVEEQVTLCLALPDVTASLLPSYALIPYADFEKVAREISSLTSDPGGLATEVQRLWAAVRAGRRQPDPKTTDWLIYATYLHKRHRLTAPEVRELLKQHLNVPLSPHTIRSQTSKFLRDEAWLTSLTEDGWRDLLRQVGVPPWDGGQRKPASGRAKKSAEGGPTGDMVPLT